MEPHRIDVHHHILPPDYVAAVGDDRIGPLILAGRTPEWTPEMSVEAMDRHGVATAVTSISAPGLWFGDDAESTRLARLCNEYAAGIRRDHPDRFGVFASLPLPDVDASLAEIEYALDTLGADGIGLLTSYGDRYPAIRPSRRCSTSSTGAGPWSISIPTDAPCSQCLPEIPAATLDFPFDTTRAVVSLLYSGTFARCRNVRFIFSHAGGTVPFLAERIARLGARPGFKEAVPNGVLPELERLYYDTALSANRLAFASLLALVSPDKVLFGSDYPFAPEATMAATVKGLIELGLEEDVLRGIERDNALALFPGITAG